MYTCQWYRKFSIQKGQTNGVLLRELGVCISDVSFNRGITVQR